jgi:hypothetical protein
VRQRAFQKTGGLILFVIQAGVDSILEVDQRSNSIEANFLEKTAPERSPMA